MFSLVEAMPSVLTAEMFSQNARGLRKEDKLEELRGGAKQRNAFAVAIQESWRVGKDTIESDGWSFVTHRKKEETCARGYGGVALLLSPKAKKAWDAAENKVWKELVHSVPTVDKYH